MNSNRKLFKTMFPLFTQNPTPMTLYTEENSLGLAGTWSPIHVDHRHIIEADTMKKNAKHIKTSQQNNQSFKNDVEKRNRTPYSKSCNDNT